MKSEGRGNANFIGEDVDLEGEDIKVDLIHGGTSNASFQHEGIKVKGKNLKIGFKSTGDGGQLKFKVGKIEMEGQDGVFDFMGNSGKNEN